MLKQYYNTASSESMDLAALSLCASASQCDQHNSNGIALTEPMKCARGGWTLPRRAAVESSSGIACSNVTAHLALDDSKRAALNCDRSTLRI